MNIKNKIKKLLFDLNFYKLTSLADTCYIMAYHRVVKTPGELFPDLSIEVFEKQIQHLSQNYTIVPMVDLVDRINKGKSLKRLVALTFDDGFKDNFTNAFPILKNFNAPATVYLITECIETGKAPWFMHFRQAFLETSLKNCDFKLGNQRFSFVLETMENRKKASDQMMAFLQKCNNHIRIEYLTHIFDLFDYHDSDHLSNMMLNWEEIREMSNHGISFGAHTHTHPVLASLDLFEAEQEIVRSKAIIEEKLNINVDEFAYPVGKRIHYSDLLFPILKNHGFKYAVTTSKDRISHHSNLHSLSRPYPWELELLK